MPDFALGLSGLRHSSGQFYAQCGWHKALAQGLRCLYKQRFTVFDYLWVHRLRRVNYIPPPSQFLGVPAACAVRPALLFS